MHIRETTDSGLIIPRPRRGRNPVIELARFVFSIMIMFWHARAYNGGGNPSFCGKMGFIAVEFFFLVSGYLLAAKAWSQRDLPYNGRDTLNFLSGKLKGLLPLYLIALTGAIIKTAVLDHLSFMQTMHQILLSFYDSALLRISGVSILQFVGGSWYISAMLIGGMIIYTLHRKYNDVFSFFIAPVSSLLLLGYLFQNYKKLDVITGGFRIFAPGLLRALAEMSIGCILFRVSAWLQQKRLTRFSSACLSLINLCCISLVFYASTVPPHKRFDYIMLVILSISVTIMFSEQSLYFRYRNRVLDKIMVYLGSLSLPIYLTHIWIKAIIIANTKEWPRQKGLALYTVVVLLFSAFCLCLVAALKRFFSKHGSAIRSVFIVDEAPSVKDS